jgi:uncharacterized protein
VTTLLDANVLIALVVRDHVHHHAAEAFLTTLGGAFATCPVTQGSLVRFLVREGHQVAAAVDVLAAVVDHPRHVFWPDALSLTDADLRGITGHRQVTDAYLAALARARGERVASLDRGLAALHGDVVDLVPIA